MTNEVKAHVENLRKAATVTAPPPPIVVDDKKPETGKVQPPAAPLGVTAPATNEPQSKGATNDQNNLGDHKNGIPAPVDPDGSDDKHNPEPKRKAKKPEAVKGQTFVGPLLSVLMKRRKR